MQCRATIALTSAASLILASCAMKVAPTGGDPDKTPAAVVKTVPADRTLNVNDQTIVFEFDDYVDRGVRNSITIQPIVKFSSTYGGDELTVTIEEDLLPNTTYAITLGTDWRDLRGNTPVSASTIIFSTGPSLDSGTITGTVSTASQTDLIVVAYANADKLDTAFNPMTVPPNYRIPVGSNGSFVIGGLRDGNYRVLSVRDRNRNALIDIGEEFSIDHSDLTITNGTSRKVGLRIDVPADTSTKKPVDTTKPAPEFGGATGVFNDSSASKPPYLMRLIDKQGRVAAAITVAQGEQWEFSTVLPGVYTVDVINDVNANGRYDIGTAYPFAFGEKWTPTGVTLTIRERWSTDDVRVILKP